MKGLAIWFVIMLVYHIVTGYASLILGEITIVHENLRLGGEFENIGQFGLLMGLSIILLFIILKNSKKYCLQSINVAFDYSNCHITFV